MDTSRSTTNREKGLSAYLYLTTPWLLFNESCTSDLTFALASLRLAHGTPEAASGGRPAALMPVRALELGGDDDIARFIVPPNDGQASLAE